MKLKIYDIENNKLEDIYGIWWDDDGKISEVSTRPGRNQLFEGQYKLVHYSDRQDAEKHDIYDGDIILVDSAFGTPHYSQVKVKKGMFTLDERPLNLFSDNELLIVGSIYENNGKIRIK